ncbi:MAG: TIR domain-containing protein, partial [Cyanobacteriota bacterium]
MPQPTPKRDQVFISYARVDRVWVDRLQRMMKPLLRAGGQTVRLWDDSQIPPGAQWRAAIETALAGAKVALLLVSDAFLASEFVMNEEVPKLLAAAEAEGLRVLWVSLSPCFVEETEIHRYQAVLRPDRHLEAMAEVEWKEALRTIGLAIREALREPLPDDGPPQPSEVGKPAQDGEPRPTRLADASAGLATEPFQLETAQIRRQGDSWQVERRPLRIDRALLELGAGVTLSLLWIPAGEFVMGSPPEELARVDDEGPRHRVRLEGFWMGQTPVTQA